MHGIPPVHFPFARKPETLYAAAPRSARTAKLSNLISILSSCLTALLSHVKTAIIVQMLFIPAPSGHEASSPSIALRRSVGIWYVAVDVMHVVFFDFEGVIVLILGGYDEDGLGGKAPFNDRGI